MNDDLFTYKVKIHELSYFPSVEQQMDDIDKRNLNSYKKQFDEYMEIKKQNEVYGLDAGMEYDPSNVDFDEWLALKFSNYMMMDWCMKNASWIYWTRGDHEEVITDDEPSNLEDGNLIEEDEIAEIFRIDTNIFHFKTPLCEAFKEFM
nr:C2 calcium/lipid-binding domain, CaLB [Tanacetum cinerariifolium]